MNEPRLQSKTPCCVKVADVRSAHHDFLWLQAQEVHGSQVGLAIRLVMFGKLSGTDEIPRQACVLCHVGEQGDIAVRERPDDELLLEASQACNRIRPRLQSMPHA